MGKQQSQEAITTSVKITIDVDSNLLPPYNKDASVSPISPSATSLTSRLQYAVSDTPDNSIESSSPSPNTRKSSHHRYQSSFAGVYNGITGTLIASRISKIAAKFWYRNIEHLNMEQRLEIGGSILSAAFSQNPDIKCIMNAQCSRQVDNNIDRKCIKYVDMIGWLLRNVLRDDIDMFVLLTNLGLLHQNMGVKMEHLDVMLQATHAAFSCYFPQEYNVSVKYAMDEIFTVVAQVMTGEELSNSKYMNNTSKAFIEKDIDFLKNLRVCLQSPIGKEYLYQYLKQTYCAEIVLFLQNISQFKSQSTCDRFAIARDIIEMSIHPYAELSINISFTARNNAMRAMEELEERYTDEEPPLIDCGLFAEVEAEIYRLILHNHWRKFQKNMNLLKNKSFGL